MKILNKNIHEIVADDLQRLLSDGVGENFKIEYKRELNLNQDKDKKEFLYDVSSFYNTEGGCIIYGIAEGRGKNSGIPKEIVGLSTDMSNDAISRKIEDVIGYNTQPNIRNIKLHFVEVNSKNVLIIGIPKLIGLPAMVTFHDTNKFYKRRNSSKYLVDVYELNRMFLQNQYIIESADIFRKERIERIISNEIYPDLNTFPFVVLHVIPHSFNSGYLLDLSDIRNILRENATSINMHPMDCSGVDQSIHNFDGFSAISYREQKIEGYDQIFRNGIYEAFSSSIIWNGKRAGQPISVLSGSEFKNSIIIKLKLIFNIYQVYNIEPPFYIGLTIYNCNPYFTITNKDNRRDNISDEIRKLFFPFWEIPISNENFEEALSPLFDIVWQSVGYSCCEESSIKQ